jgi:hypothetical protein
VVISPGGAFIITHWHQCYVLPVHCNKDYIYRTLKSYFFLEKKNHFTVNKVQMTSRRAHNNEMLKQIQQKRVFCYFNVTSIEL